MEKNIIIQIYEVQTPYEAEKLIKLGVNNIGSVIVSEEKWKNAQLKDTIKLTKSMASKSSIIPLFDDKDTIFSLLDYYEPDIIHFCDIISDNQEMERKCGNLIFLQEQVKHYFPKIKIMRSIPIPLSGSFNINFDVYRIAQMFESVTDYFLTDTLITDACQPFFECQPVKGFIGITGKTCDWNIARELVEKSSIPVILAGGITPCNVFDAIMHVKPAGVDSCTGTNALGSDGNTVRFKKDLDKVKHLIQETLNAQKSLEI